MLNATAAAAAAAAFSEKCPVGVTAVARGAVVALPVPEATPPAFGFNKEIETTGTLLRGLGTLAFASAAAAAAVTVAVTLPPACPCPVTCA